MPDAPRETKPGPTAGYRHQPSIAAVTTEHAMTFHEYLAKARQHDAQRAGERDRLIQQARQNRTARRHHAGPAARALSLARLILRRVPV